MHTYQTDPPCSMEKIEGIFLKHCLQVLSYRWATQAGCVVKITVTKRSCVSATLRSGSCSVEAARNKREIMIYEN